MTKIEDAAKLVEQKSPNDVVIIHPVKIKCLLTDGVIQYRYCYHCTVAGKERWVKGKKYTSWQSVLSPFFLLVFKQLFFFLFF